jgi:membrane protease YdiL (CAAX protease family)
LAVVLGGLLVWSGIRLRPKAQKIRERYRDRAEAILPDTTQERSWFGAISVGAGISEELLFRGFLFYYLALWLPHINKLECVLVTSLIFGLGHLYQGWKGVVGTGVGGLLLAGLYVLSGNLLLPMVFHAVADLRVLMILPPESEALATAGEAA